ncbi:MAG TPA: Lrp/AsnC family transcriptional regulator [Allosphingosinicella sp.]|uniref:Lrp/AsnC family transcriptional regulator n=1 Tax=Allosphingosinicella sp. TaxID=2823234 RepID=UPI002ED88B7F
MKSTYKLDRFEARILRLLQTYGRLSHAEIGRRIGLSPSAVAERIRNLEAEQVILGYAAIVDAERVGLPITAMITMTCDGERCRKLPGEVEAIPEVVECHRLTGDASAILKVVVPSIRALEALVDKLALFGKPSTALVLSRPFTPRPLPYVGDAEGTPNKA